MKLEELRVYQRSLEIGESVWEIVSSWTYFEKDTVGKQWVRAVDSIAANISEGYGRYHYKENKQFLFYARGSLYETKTWLTKAKNRNLLSETAYGELEAELEVLAPMLNKFLSSIGPSSSDQVNEESASYSFEENPSYLPMTNDN